MRKSESTKELVQALCKASPEFTHITKNKKVNYGQTSFEYADLDQCIHATKPALEKNGLQVIQGTEVDINGNVAFCTMLIHASGEYIESQIPMPTFNKMQDMGSALSYLRRYYYCSILNITADTDNDAVHTPLIKKPATEDFLAEFESKIDPNVLDSIGATPMSGGKMAGKPFREIIESHMDYVDWASKQQNIKGQLRDLIDYARQMGAIQ